MFVGDVCTYLPDHKMVYINNSKKRVKFTLVQAMRLCTGRTVHRESRGIAVHLT